MASIHILYILACEPSIHICHVILANDVLSINIEKGYILSIPVLFEPDFLSYLLILSY